MPTTRGNPIMKRIFSAPAMIAAIGIVGTTAQGHVFKNNLNEAPTLVIQAFNPPHSPVADPCANAIDHCQSANNFTRYGWMGGTTPFLENSHYITTNADEFDFHLDRAATVTITVAADSVQGANLNPAFTVYKGQMPLQAHDDEPNDPLNPTAGLPPYPPIASPKDAAPGDPNVSQVLTNPDYTTQPNPAWTDQLAGTYQTLYAAHNGYRDTLNHTPLGDFNLSYHGQFDAFGDWSMYTGINVDPAPPWAKINYISSVSNTPCPANGPCNGENTVGGYSNPGHFQGSDGLTETLTLQLAAGDYAIWAGGESALCDGAAGRGPCYTVVNGSKTNQPYTTANNDHLYATVRIAVQPLAVNNPPVAAIKASANQIRAGSSFALDGTTSTDADPGDIICASCYAWSAPAGIALSSTTAPTTSFIAAESLAGQTLQFCLTVKDNQGADSAPDCVSLLVTPDNTAPTVTIKSQTVREGASVNLQPAVADPDGDGIASYSWRQTGGIPVTLAQTKGPGLAVAAPMVGEGSNTLAFSLTVTDDYAARPLSATATATVTVGSDPSLLDCSAATANPATLWPPNKSMKPITIGGIAGPDPYNLSITGIASDEPVKNKAGKDNTGPDARIKRGVATRKEPQARDSALLRAERQLKAGPGNGRVYTVNFTATDGNQDCDGSVTVEVPATRGQGAGNDGQDYTATDRK